MSTSHRSRSLSPSLVDIDASVIHHMHDDQDARTTMSADTAATSAASVPLTTGSTKTRPEWMRTSSSRSGSRSKSRAGELMTLIVDEAQRQATSLRAALDTTNDRLEHEMRRAEMAIQRAEAADGRARDAYARAAALGAAKHAAELEATRAKEDARLLRAQLDAAQRDLRRSQAMCDTLEDERNTAEESAARARDAARELQMQLEIEQARQEGWQEGREAGIADGRAAARAKSGASKEVRREAFDKGRKRGWQEGRAVERETATEQFSQFLNEHEDELYLGGEAGGYDDDSYSFISAPSTVRGRR